MIALIRPANRMLAWPAMIANAISAMLGTAWLVAHGVRTLEDLGNLLLYPVIALIVGPCLVIATLWHTSIEPRPDRTSQVRLLLSRRHARVNQTRHSKLA
jgi:hypothetical protein